MTPSDKKSKRKGIIGTIMFHSLLIVCFIFMGLTYQDPPPAEEGISIDFGFINDGLGEIEPEDTEELTEIVEEEIIEEQIESVEEIVTQSVLKTPTVEKTKEKKKVIEKEDPKQEVIEEKKPEVNKKALYPGKKENTKTSEGNKTGNGNQGIIDGDPNADVYTGGGSGVDGTTYQLGGRDVAFKAKPIYNLQVEGKVVVMITVDQLGNVISAIPGSKGSTTLNKQLLQRAKAAALKTKFDPKQTAPTNQQGKIIYYFQLN